MQYAVKKPIGSESDETWDYYFSGSCWVGVRKGQPIPPRCRFELRGEARDTQREVGGRIVEVKDTTTHAA